MGKRDKRFDAYIAKSPDWAKPILTAIRETVHEACPEAEETLKWSHPTFMYNGIMCGMVAFKERCAFHFWKHALLKPATGTDPNLEKLDQLRTVKDLPPKKVLHGYIKRAMELNDSGAKVMKRPTKPKAPLVVPDYFTAAVKKNKKAMATFEGFSPSAQREYVEWITGAKSEDTRERRLAQAVEWMAEGKQRNWKYMR